MKWSKSDIWNKDVSHLTEGEVGKWLASWPTCRAAHVVLQSGPCTPGQNNYIHGVFPLPHPFLPNCKKINTAPSLSWLRVTHQAQSRRHCPPLVSKWQLGRSRGKTVLVNTVENLQQRRWFFISREKKMAARVDFSLTGPRDWKFPKRITKDWIDRISNPCRVARIKLWVTRVWNVLTLIPVY